jgi:acetyltransferase-like isoleucine patch superfamily enzyme
MTLDMPWKAGNELRRMLLLPWAHWTMVRVGIVWQPGWRLYGLPIIQKHRRSTLRIGRDMHLRSSVRSNPLGPNHPCILSTRRAGASLIIGDSFQMTGGSIVCEDTIRIGHRVMVGCNSVIADTDFHPLDSAQRQGSPLDGATAPVFIEDDVFIGMNSLVLKGVRLGKGCVIGAGSVVTQDVPPGAIAAGSPARVIREAN